MIVSIRQSRAGFGEHRSRADSPDPGNGTEDLDGAVLFTVALLAHFFQQLLGALGQQGQLLVEQLQAGQQQEHLFGQSQSHPGRQRQTGLQMLGQLRGRETADAVRAQQRLNLLGGELRSQLGQGFDLPLTRAIADSKGAVLAGALEAPDSELLGKDAGVLAGLPANGVKLSAEDKAHLRRRPMFRVGE